MSTAMTLHQTCSQCGKRLVREADGEKWCPSCEPIKEEMGCQKESTTPSW